MNYNQAIELLLKVQQVIPGAIIAGGFLRDWHALKTPKDLDIFVPSGVHDWAAIGAVPAFNGAGGYMALREVSGIYELTDTFIPVQLITLQPGLSPIERAKQHDFGICQVWHDGVALGHTKAFTDDLFAGTFTLTHCESKSEFDRSMRRWERLSTKYQGWSLVIPEEFKQWKN